MLRLFDTARGEVRELELREPGKVSMYVCGPTVYGPPHLGHGRMSLVFDVLRRYLEWSGYDVLFVSNITDVDDNIINRANREGIPWTEVAVHWERAYWEGMDAIGVKRPTIDPHASAFIDRMVELISDLVDHGMAYETADGVYFQAASGRGLRAARAPVHRLVAGRCACGGERGQAITDRLRVVEEGEARRAVVAVAVG